MPLTFRFLGPSGSVKAVLLAASICAVGGEQALSQDAQGQPTHRLFGDARDCPPGHRIEFVLPATTIYVEARWLGSMTIGDLKDRGGPACPTGPVKLVSVEFSKNILRALDLHHGVGTRLFRLDVGGNPNDPQTLTSARRSDMELQHPAPWIDDDTVLKNVPDSRGYRLNYPAAKGAPNRPIRISCGETKCTGYAGRTPLRVRTRPSTTSTTTTYLVKPACPYRTSRQSIRRIRRASQAPYSSSIRAFEHGS